MSGRSYMLAARMPMSREAFEAWLDEPAPGVEAIANPGAVWDEWTPAYASETARERLAIRGAAGFALARHRDGVLELYLYDYYYSPGVAQSELLLLAAAGRRAEAESAVMFWGGNVYPDLPLGGDEPIAVLLTGPDGARFTDRYRLSALLEHLRPVETAFLAAAGAGDEDATWNPDGMVDPALQPAG
ncbi:hypothetical protein ABT369_22120 [Dactylosporangium sp. NPDC000244]|uniref:hypothetical protein n=1 Tax=Dactylosporangium sp. NPDC000244 TaxID=3154365 RepID=UPI00332974A3